MSDITTSDVVAKVRELAAESPDYVYEVPPGGQCVNYVMDASGNPIPMSGCIVGQALDALGVDMALVRPGCAVGPALKYAGISFGDYDDDTRWLANVQIHQDEGAKWSDAVERADLNE